MLDIGRSVFKVEIALTNQVLQSIDADFEATKVLLIQPNILKVEVTDFALSMNMDWEVKNFVSDEVGKAKIDFAIDFNFDLELTENEGRPNFLL
mmetsp:Transcript_34984/g.6295  ORF Transcript_34984/g.6295 Transcript_34984/m.6295 type:complete len:94 (-) Transcript_34984:1050-1331(-)